MEALLKAIASGLVEKPEEIVVTSEEQENGTTVYHLHVAEDDMGRVIGSRAASQKRSEWSCARRLPATNKRSWSKSTEQRRAQALFCLSGNGRDYR